MRPKVKRLTKARNWAKNSATSNGKKNGRCASRQKSSVREDIIAEIK